MDLAEVLHKIDSKTVTVEDFNSLISKCLLETTPEAIRDRVRRRVNHNQDSVRRHQDSEGHTSVPKMAGRVQPKRERSNNTQMQHRGKSGHRHSARTQKRTMSKSKSDSLRESLDFISKHIGKPIDESVVGGFNNHDILHRVATRLMSKTGIDRDWLFELCEVLDNGRHR